MRVPAHIYVDFDATISLYDTTDLLLQRFADPAWVGVEAAWERGEIGSRECMLRQVDLMRVAPDALDAFLAEIELDPHFPDFVRLCGALGASVTVVSDGLDRSVQAALRRYGLDIAAVANRLEWCGGERWKLSFPFAAEDCRSLAGHCKCRSLENGRELRVLVGDGRSDFCAAREADMVFAKSTLLTHCRAQGLAHTAFSDFAELSELFANWLATDIRTFATSLPIKEAAHAE